MDMGKAGDQCRAVERLEFVELGNIDQPGNDLPHVVLLLQIDRHDAVEFGSVELGLPWLSETSIAFFPAVQSTDDLATERQCMAIVLGVVIRNTGFSGMHVSAAE